MGGVRNDLGRGPPALAYRLGCVARELREAQQLVCRCSVPSRQEKPHVVSCTQNVAYPITSGLGSKITCIEKVTSASNHNNVCHSDYLSFLEVITS